MASAQRQHPVLKLGACAGRSGLFIRAQWIADRQVEKPSFPNRGIELGWGEEGAEISEGARGFRDRDALLSRAFHGQ